MTQTLRQIVLGIIFSIFCIQNVGVAADLRIAPDMVNRAKLKPDLVVTDLEGVRVNGGIIINATWKNNGLATAQNFIVKLRARAGGKGGRERYWYTLTVIEVSPGQTRHFQRSLKFRDYTNLHQCDFFEFVADPENSVDESSENNNKKSIIVPL